MSNIYIAETRTLFHFFLENDLDDPRLFWHRWIAQRELHGHVASRHLLVARIVEIWAEYFLAAGMQNYIKK